MDTQAIKDWYYKELEKLANEFHVYLLISSEPKATDTVFRADFRKDPYTEYHENRRLFWVDISESARGEKEREHTLMRIRYTLANWLSTAHYS